jgi:adenosylcobyric acid synthase
VKAEFLETHSTLSAYEMHMGKTTGPDTNQPLFKIKNDEDQIEGAQNLSGKVMGTYLHGLFQADEFRNNFLQKLYKNFESQTAYKAQIETTLNELSDHIAKTLNIKEIEKVQSQ